MLNIQFENKKPKQFTLADLRTGDIFRFKDSHWGRSKEELFLVTFDKVIDLKTFRNYDKYDLSDLFTYNSFYGDEEDWEYFVDSLRDGYEIEIFDADITLKKIVDR